VEKDNTRTEVESFPLYSILEVIKLVEQETENTDESKEEKRVRVRENLLE
jgi:hypothetical protein